MHRSLPIIAAVLASTLASPAYSADDWVVLASAAGSIRLERSGAELASIAPVLFEVPWRQAALDAGRAGETAKDGLHHGQIHAPGGAIVEVEMRATAVEEGTRLDYRLTPKSEVKLNTLNVTITLPATHWIGGKLLIDGKETALPERLDQMALFSGRGRALQLVLPSGAALDLEFASPTMVRVQDDRKWGQTFSIRLESEHAPELWAADQTMSLSVTMQSPEGIQLEEDEPITISAGKEWIPLEVDTLDIEPDSALDFSKIIPRHAVAGERGRVIVNEAGKFAFEKEPAVPARFYGVNLCFSAQYLEHAEADRLAERLARLGYNAVRIHHYESGLVGTAPSENIQLDPEKLDELDYLFAALKRHGLYATTDLFVSRPVALGAIYEGESGAIGMDEYKLAVHVNGRAFENYKAFTRALLQHVNPYTKVSYAEDPALAWLGLVNEDCPGNFIGTIKGKLKEDWNHTWNRWLAVRYPNRAQRAEALGHHFGTDQDLERGTIPMPGLDGQTPDVIIFNVFLAEVERDFYERTRKFLREELHCRALLSDCSAWTNPVQLQAVRTEFDYVDDHFYVDHPKFLEQPWRLPSKSENKSPVAAGAAGGRERAFTRLFGKPFTVTEFNYAGPGRFRGVGGILTGALGALQDWDGIWRFAYSHNRENVERPLAMDYFNVAGDPLNQAAERASFCLFLRGDLQPAAHSVAITSSVAELLESPKTSCDRTPPWHEAAWLTRIGWRIGGRPEKVPGELDIPFAGGEPWAAGRNRQIFDQIREAGALGDANRTDVKKTFLQSDGGQLTIDAPGNTLTLDTPFTAGGFAPAGGKIFTHAVEIDVLDTDATVWISSLDGAPISGSKRLLITHLTDLQNTGTVYAERSRQVLLGWGRLPYLVRAGRALVHLEHDDATQAKVYALDTSGKRIGEVAATGYARQANLDAPNPGRRQLGGLVATSDARSRARTIPLSVSGNGQARMLYEVVFEK